MAVQIQQRRGTASQWTTSNPVLAEGEMGVETDTLKVKIGNGTTAWTSLPYFTQGAVGATGATGPQGPTGATGATGPTGPAGPANNLTVSGVTTGTAGSSANVVVSGTSPNQSLAFTIPKGDKGDAATVAVGTVTALTAGSAPTVANSGTSGAAVFNFGIPNAVGVPTGGSTGQVLSKTSTATAWSDPSLDFLSDVAITSPSNGQSLVYESATSTWKNATPATTLDGLSDVTVSSPADKQVLQYEASTSQWKNKVASGGVTVSATAPSSPIAGDAWFDSNDGLLYVYFNDGNSSQWVEVKANSALNADLLSRVATVESRATVLETADATMNKSGLVPIIPTSVSINAGTASVDSTGLVTFTGGSSLTVSGVFSSSYTNYRIIYDFETGSGGADIYFQLRNSGGTLGTAYYNYGTATSTSSAVAGTYGANNGYFNVGRTQGSYGTFVTMDINNPGNTKVKRFHSMTVDQFLMRQSAGYNFTSTAYTDFIIYPNATNATTGTLKIYGYR